MKRANVDANGSAAHRPSKRQALSADGVQQCFRSGLLEPGSCSDYQKKYANSEPYKHGVIQGLLDPDLLRAVRDEIQSNISFTPKETDIYKIYQSGDLANLDGLDDSSLQLLPSLVKLRGALYSRPFRDFLSQVTGAGALSGTKTDMAVNVYNPTCHLLCHDDVIGSRRVSYILYLTDPDRPWRAEWGGALRLYPTKVMTDEDGGETKVPQPTPTTVIPPAFNQLSFFAVQPGESFHDVEEVYSAHAVDASSNGTANGKSKAAEGGADDEDKYRVRMAISGWFHIPQAGEDGFEEGLQEKTLAKSSLAQLQGNADQYDEPKPRWGNFDISPGPGKSGDLDEDDLNQLLTFMNPRYLTPDVVDELKEAFGDEFNLRLADFLSAKAADAIMESIKADEAAIDMDEWNEASPPHKHRYLFRQSRDEDSLNTHSSSPNTQSSLIFAFGKPAFCKWLTLVTGLSMVDCNIMARRFRRGVDYTLATSYNEEQPQLEVCLGLTPSTGWAADADGDPVDGEDVNGDATIDVPAAGPPSEPIGGYEIYMAEDEDEEDGGGDEGMATPWSLPPSSHTGAGRRRERADPAIYRAAGAGGGGDGEDEDDGILFTAPAAWNTLSLVLRDKGTLKFVKYVSRSARGDRFDVTGEYRVVDEHGLVGERAGGEEGEEVSDDDEDDDGDEAEDGDDEDDDSAGEDEET